LFQISNGKEKRKSSGETSMPNDNGAGGEASMCPTDKEEEARAFWEDFFAKHCNVEWDDIGDIRDKMSNAVVATPLEPSNNTCRIFVFIASGQDLSFDVRSTARGNPWEGWEPVPAKVGGVVGNPMRQIVNMNGLNDVDPCAIFDSSVPRLEQVSGENVGKLFEQLQDQFPKDCDGSEKTNLVFAGRGPLQAKKTMVVGGGAPSFVMEMSVATSEGSPVNLQVTATAHYLTDAEVFEEREESEAMSAQIAKEESAEVERTTASYLQQSIFNVDARSDVALGGNADVGKKIESLAANGDTSHLKPRIGDWTLTNVQPPLSCLCHPNRSICVDGAEIPPVTPASLIEVERQEAWKGNPYTTPLHGSPKTLHAPPRKGTPAPHTLRQPPNFGDNFLSNVLPKRTPTEHAKIWAQSRSLVETARHEGVVIPDAYHFFDDDARTRCFQKAYDQGKCGSCWAFAALGALEKQICMNANGIVKPSLSREMLVRCSEQNNGCGGGNADKAYEDLMEIGGVFKTDCLPYQGNGAKHCPVFQYSWFGQGSVGKTGQLARIDQEMQKSCPRDDDLLRYSNRPPLGKEWDMPFQMLLEARGNHELMTPSEKARLRRNFERARSRDRVSSWWLYGEEAMKTALIKHGSIYASFEVRDDFTKRICDDGCWPPGTVYGQDAAFAQASCGSGSGHAVHVIGFGTEIQEAGMRIDYWLIENSWGEETHGNLLGNDVGFDNPFGADPWTEDYPAGAEGKCVLAGWAKVKGKDGDGFHLGINVGGKIVVEKDIQGESLQKFNATLNLAPGDHSVTFMMYSKDHQLQNGIPKEHYQIVAPKIRCRGRGYGFNFVQNSNLAATSWGRQSRSELRAAANALLANFGIGASDRFSACPEQCRTGRYTEFSPCLGLLMNWGSCYTYSWAFNDEYYTSRSVDCRSCAKERIDQAERALAIRALPNDTFIEWHNITSQMATAPDEAGWAQERSGSCKIITAGFNDFTQLSATYTIHVPSGNTCDEKHSALVTPGVFVNAPHDMASGASAMQRCPMPMLGQVSLRCTDGVLYVEGNSCSSRSDVNLASRGYYRMLRGHNYHGIETGAAFAVPEMSRDKGLCRTTGWTHWSTCNATMPCEVGVQTRTREPVGNQSKTEPKCQGIQFFQSRGCIGPGFCDEVLARFSAIGASSVDGFDEIYKTDSIKLPNPTAGSLMIPSSYQSCSEATSRCQTFTGKTNCDMLFEGHFKVNKGAHYILNYEASEGGGELEFNAFGQGNEKKPQFKVVAKDGTSTLYEWIDVGFHHRRRRSGSKPWVQISSMTLEPGTYFARMTRVGWTSCPTFTLKLEQSTSMYGPVRLATEVVGSSPAWSKNFGYDHPTDKGNFEAGFLNELVVMEGRRRSYQRNLKVQTKKKIDSLDFTADDLYNMTGLNRFSPNVNKFQNYEVKLRGTAIIGEAGHYSVRVQIDKTHAEWRNTGYRRRHIKAVVRLQEKTAKAISMDGASGLVSVSQYLPNPGQVKVEVSVVCDYSEGHNYKMALPNVLKVELKKVDFLHGEALAFGTKMHYRTNIKSLRGEEDVRVDWPDASDPLSSALRVSTFKELLPSRLLIGATNLKGFAATVEAKIDAGACLSLEARAPQGKGLALELCDVDGRNQYLQLLTYPTDANATRTRVGWVHIHFTQPTHLRIVRSPSDPLDFQVSYRPDDRQDFAYPFSGDELRNNLGAMTGDTEMDVGVSMTTMEAYRYAEFYNISIEECPSSCNAKTGGQLLCGDVTTACGTSLSCPATCGSEMTCWEGECVSCSGNMLTTEQQDWQCGDVPEVCTTQGGEFVQIRRVIGESAPSAAHTCNTTSHRWECRGKSAWAFLLDGKECGSTVNECGEEVELWRCPLPRAECVDNTCECDPLPLPQIDSSWECGSVSDGCGSTVHFERVAGAGLMNEGCGGDRPWSCDSSTHKCEAACVDDSEGLRRVGGFGIDSWSCESLRHMCNYDHMLSGRDFTWKHWLQTWCPLRCNVCAASLIQPEDAPEEGLAVEQARILEEFEKQMKTHRD
jgi:hypothetical protein